MVKGQLLTEIILKEGKEGSIFLENEKLVTEKDYHKFRTEKE